jgi:hypothetical protein
MSSNSSSMPRLGPAWRSSGAGGSGRGFQPPPAVPDETRDRSGSHASGGTSGSGADKNRNPFSLLDDEDDGGGGAPASNSSSGGGADKNSRGGSSNRGPPAPTNDRFSALKSSESSRPYSRSSSSGPRPGGRSLADLAAGLSSTGGDGIIIIVDPIVTTVNQSTVVPRRGIIPEAKGEVLLRIFKGHARGVVVVLVWNRTMVEQKLFDSREKSCYHYDPGPGGTRVCLIF